MQSHPVQLSDVIYNPINQSFEALATVYQDNQGRKYACAIDAPITMSFEDAAEGLKRQALRHHRGKRFLYSELRRHVATPRAGRSASGSLHWIERLMGLPGRFAA